MGVIRREPRETRGGDGVGSAPLVVRPCFSDMTREEARNVFGGSIVNNLLSLGAEPTNVVRQDGLIEWKSDGYIEVGGVQVWAYYYFEDGEDVDRCDWEDHMEIEVEECWI